MEDVMPQINIFDVSINYTDNNKPHRAVVCLHGWGQHLQMMNPIVDHFGESFRTVNIDLPGFGLSDPPLRTWGITEYTEAVKQLLETLQVNEPIFVAHSFGARIAIQFASQYPTCKLILTGAAGIKPKKTIGHQLKLVAYKSAKQLFKLPLLRNYQENMRQLFGSADYRSITGVMRSTFVKIVNEDLTPLLPKIQAPTLLIWGEVDDSTPLWMGKVMEKKIPDVGLIIFEEDDHYAYWNQMQRFLRICDSFLNEDKEIAS